MRHSGLVSGNHIYSPELHSSQRPETERKHLTMDVSHLRNRLSDCSNQRFAAESFLVHPRNHLYGTDLYGGIRFRNFSKEKKALPLGLQSCTLEYQFRNPSGLYPLLVCHRTYYGKTDEKKACRLTRLYAYPISPLSKFCVLFLYLEHFMVAYILFTILTVIILMIYG